MSNDKWKASQDLHDELKVLIGSHHPWLIDIADDIVVIFKEKCSRVGNKPVLGKTSKAPKILEVLGERAYAFVIELADDMFRLMNDDQKIALLDSLLCEIAAEEDETNGERKYSLRAPDIQYYDAEIERHGHWKKEVFDAISASEVQKASIEEEYKPKKEKKAPHNQKQEDFFDE